MCVHQDREGGGALPPPPSCITMSLLFLERDLYLLSSLTVNFQYSFKKKIFFLTTGIFNERF